MSADTHYDVVIVGAGIAGALIAQRLGQAGKKVLILEAGPGVPPSREGYMENFYLNAEKTPSAPYPPDISDPDPAAQNAPRATIQMLINANNPFKSYLVQQGPLPFASTYERVAGGTTWHWLGTSLRLLPDDFQLSTKYGHGRDWPIPYQDLTGYYADAEKEIGVAANVADQLYMKGIYPEGYEYPMPGIPETVLDQSVAKAVEGRTWDGNPVQVAPTPQARNSVPYDDRRVCAGNTNCIPICPIQAKYDATITIGKALDTGNVTIMYQTVASKVLVDESSGKVSGIEYLQYRDRKGPQTGAGTVTADRYVLAAHAIETPKLLLNSATARMPNGAANSSDQVGRNLMDHVIYLAWALMPEPTFPFRGPLSTSGIESLREGPFRKERAAYRIEIGNAGWNFPIGDPYVTAADFIDGTDNSQLNPAKQRLFGAELVAALNGNITRQMRLGFLLEQLPDPDNRVTLSQAFKDHLGLPRPQIHYTIDEYTQNGLKNARKAATQLFDWMGAKEYTQTRDFMAAYFKTSDGEAFNYFGAGHILGTTIMGDDPGSSVVNPDLRAWDHDNLYICGTNVFPAEGTANPTLTLAALAMRCADHLLSKG